MGTLVTAFFFSMSAPSASLGRLTIPKESPRLRFLARAASSRRLDEHPPGNVGLEQSPQLLGRVLRGLDELHVVVAHGVLRRELRLVVLLEEGDRPLRGGDAQPELQQRLVRSRQTGW